MKNSSRAARACAVGQKDQLGVRETHLNEMIRVFARAVNKELSWFVFPLGEMVSSGKKDFRGSSFVMFFDCDDRSFAHF
ncbi:hypothetical protein ACFX1T_010161 [Malus domestica]